MAFLEIRNIDKQYEGEPLLAGVSLDVAQGEIVSLLGPSGSGKTTLLRIIAGLEPAEGGQVFLEGEDISRIPTHRRGIVLMFQDYALFPHRTVAENVAFGLKMQRASRSEMSARVAEMLELVGLESFGPRNVVELSGGERQRVALARSLATHPRLLLLDEPLGSLDRTLRERLLEELEDILRRVGVTTIAVTHDQAEAFALADRVALLHDTAIVQAGSPEEVYCNPATPWVARFLGLTNLFPATVVGEGEVETPLGQLTVDGMPASLDVGASGMLLVLPWGIHLHRSDPAAPNAFQAVITHRIFQGPTTKFVLQLNDGILRFTQEMGDAMPDVGVQIEGWIDPSTLRWI